jgi:glutamate/aspartate transport system permease protein
MSTPCAAIPLVMVILWFFLLIPLVIGTPLGAETSAIITFTLFEAAYYCEIMRAGIQSVPRGQVAAGYALGMSYGADHGPVVLPQAFRNMLPVLLTQTIILFQDTSLVYAIGAYDLLKGLRRGGQELQPPGGDLPGRRRAVLHHLLQPVHAGQETAAAHRHRPLKGNSSCP